MPQARLRAFALLLLLGAALQPARAHEAAGAAQVSKTIELPAREFHEECLELTPRQRLHYSFRSAQPVEFNIHYHRGNDVIYPVRMRNARAAHSAFVPRRSDGYCLMWSNVAGRSVKLEFQYSVRSAAAGK